MLQWSLMPSTGQEHHSNHTDDSMINTYRYDNHILITCDRTHGNINPPKTPPPHYTNFQYNAADLIRKVPLDVPH